MAFILSVPPRHSKFIPSNLKSTTHSLQNLPVPRHRRPKLNNIVSLARSHNYGNGGIVTKGDYTGYDPEAILREFNETKERLEREGADATGSSWVLVVNENIVSKNYLYEESVQKGFKVEFSDTPLIVVMAKTAAETEIEQKIDSVYIVRDGGRDVTFTLKDKQEALLCFERKEEANQFMLDLIDIRGSGVDLQERNTMTTKKECDRNDQFVGLVVKQSAISPSMLGIK